MGDRAPPVTLIQPSKFKAKPKWSHPIHPWSVSTTFPRSSHGVLRKYREISSFTNPARKDGLVLRHWSKKKIPAAATPGAPATPADLKSEAETDVKATQTEPQYHFAKFNVRVNVPQYTDSDYDSLLKSNDWSKKETDYLIDLASEFDLRWILIADRYEYRPPETPSNGDSMAVTVPAKARTMEDLKARYYDVAAKIMAHQHPLSSMSTTEFELHEKMTKFNATQETTRKKLAEALLSRSPEEIREEEILLGELKRIVANEERFSQERKELYSRLEAPPSNGSIAMYESSQGLAQLMQTLFAVDKKKRRSLMGPNDGTSSPATGSSQNLTGQGSSRDQRNSIGGVPNKKGSVSQPPSQRPLSTREEAKFGVTHHERLTSGVQFRSARIDKLVLAKSAAQSSKLQEGLTELGIPHKAVMPTAKVCAEYERLIQGVQTLLDVRKVSEKVESEIRVLQAQQRERERREAGEEPETPFEEEKGVDGDEEDKEARAEAEADEEAARKEEEDEKGSEEDDDADGDDGENGEDDAEGEADEDEADDVGQEVEVDEDADDAEDSVDVDQADRVSDDEEGQDENGEGEEQDEGEEGEGEDQDADENGDGSEDDGDAEPDEEDAADERRPSATASMKSAAAHKRSASVLSAQSEKSTKRQRK